MLEKTLTKHITDWMKTQPDIYFFKTMGGPFQRRGIPDIVGSVGPVAFYFELKVKPNKLTLSQEVELRKIRSSGATASVVYSLEEVQRLIERLRTSNK